MRCASRSVPSVAATRACVSPRVNSADPLDLHGVERDAGLLEAGHHRAVRIAARLRARLLAADLVGGAKGPFAQLGDLGDEGLVLRRRLPLPLGLAGVAHQLVDGGDGDVALLVAEDHGTEHHLLAELFGLALHHQHRAPRAGDDEIELALRELRRPRVEHVLAVDVADARGADRPVERDAADRQRRAGADHRRDVGLHVGVQAQHVDDDLHLVEEAVGEQRPDRAVDEPAGQRLELARAPLALEEAAGDLAGRVGLLDVVDGEREEVLAGLCLTLGDDGGQHDGVFHRDHDGTGALAGDLARLERDGVVAPGEGLRDLVEHAHAWAPRGKVEPTGDEATMPFQRAARRVTPRWNDTAGARAGSGLRGSVPAARRGRRRRESITCAGRACRSAPCSARRPGPSGRPAAACAG